MNCWICDVCNAYKSSTQKVLIDGKWMHCYCKHRTQYKKYGKFLDNNPRNKRDRNEIIVKEYYAEIILYDNDSFPYQKTIIDIEDIEKIKNIKWIYANTENNGYCEGKINKRFVRLHRFLMGIENESKEIQVDHINNNRLDNRKSNLRVCTNLQNSQNSPLSKNNTSGYIGVCWNPRNNNWMARIEVNKKRVNLGSYYDMNNAILARLKAEKEYFKEYAPQKHLFGKYGIALD
jgi:hypothetical protein